jgi:hypothetical protein
MTGTLALRASSAGGGSVLSAFGRGGRPLDEVSRLLNSKGEDSCCLIKALIQIKDTGGNCWS